MEEFLKYPKIYTIGKEENQDLLKDPDDEIIIEEKIDGANFRFMIKDGRIIFGSRNQSIGDSNQEIGGNWKRCVEHVKQSIAEKMTGTEEFEKKIYYGECMAKHTMDYDWKKIPPFLGFDILDLTTNKFLRPSERNHYFNRIGFLSSVPFIWGGKVHEFKGWMQNREVKFEDESIVPISKYASPSSKDPKAEGIVIKNYDKQIFAKYVRSAFKEKNEEVFGMNKKFAENDDERIVAMYCTNARIDKMIFKLIDEGNKLDMPLMAILPKKVIEDIMEENWREICMSTWSVNFKGVRKKVTNRCLEVLKQMIFNNSLNNETTK